MIDPMTALSFSVYNNKGIYAFLLGSGVSRSASILTGWEIVLDLIKKIAIMDGINFADISTECELIDWYKKKYKRDPDYRDILQELAPSQVDRSRILRNYFEPDDEDIKNGRKMPTKAHRVIANLVKNNYIKVILTTNFDKLLERSLLELGVEYNVISTPDTLHGVMPIAHSKCTIIKVNGDYNDIRIKNTADELAQYDENIEKLLDRIFDEYGLIVCGWSSEWDIALRNAIIRCSSRRFSSYWASMGQPISRAQELIDLRSATIINITSADDFFTKLGDRINALNELDSINPDEKDAILALVKEYVRMKSYDIRFHDLMFSITDHLYKAARSKKFSNGEEEICIKLEKCIKYYESISELLVSIFMIVFYWGNEQQQNLLISCLEKIADIPDRNAPDFWNSIKYYPSLLLLYAGGLSSVYAENYVALASLLLKTRVENNIDLTLSDPIIKRVNNSDVLNYRYSSMLFNSRVKITSCSEYLEKYFISRFSELVTFASDFANCFDRFEYLLSLSYAYYHKNDHIWGTVGHYAWRHENNKDLSIKNIITREVKTLKQNSPILRAGLFEKKLANLLDIKERFDLFATNMVNNKKYRSDPRRFRKID